MEVEEDDPVVAEFDVVLDSNPDLQLHLLQYPLRPCYRPYGDEGELTAVRMQAGRVEMDYQLKQDSGNFAKNGGKDTSATHTLTGTAVPMMTNYCVGLVKDQVLHLTPVDTAFQVRPSFQYLTAKEKPEERVELQAKVGRKRPTPRKKPTETWTSLDFRSSTDPESDLILDQLTSSKAESMHVDGEMAANEYIDLLLPEQKAMKGQLERIHSKDWRIQIEEILGVLKTGVSPQTILTFLKLPPSVSTAEAIRVIEEKAKSP